MQLNGTYDVKLGKSFLDPNSAKYLTMRCDFMPASVDRTQPGSIKVDDGKEVVVNLPNVASVGPGSTVFRGSARPVQKECILIYNKRTGELTLERIAHAVQLKKTREERKTSQPNVPAFSASTTDSQSNPPRRKGVSDGDRDTGKTTSASLSKQRSKDATTSKSTVSSVKPRTLSSSDSSDGGSDGGGGAGVNSCDGSEGQHEVASDTDSGTDSNSSSSLSTIVSKPQRRPLQSSTSPLTKQTGTGSLESSFLSVHRKLIEHDLKLSDSESDDGQ